MDYRNYGNGGSTDRLKMALRNRMRRAENGTMINGGQDKPKVFVASGYDNRGADPSGREMMGLFVRTPQGPKQITPQELAEMYPESNGDIRRAYELAGISVDGKGGTVGFPQARDTAYNQRLMSEFGVGSMDELREKLNIGRVGYERQRDLPKVVPNIRTDY